jgi:hypothetical protein
LGVGVGVPPPPPPPLLPLVKAWKAWVNAPVDRLQTGDRDGGGLSVPIRHAHNY